MADFHDNNAETVANKTVAAPSKWGVEKHLGWSSSWDLVQSSTAQHPLQHLDKCKHKNMVQSLRAGKLQQPELVCNPRTGRQMVNQQNDNYSRLRLKIQYDHQMEPEQDQQST